MMDFKFEELRVYRQAVDLSSNIFSITSDWPNNFRFSLGDQLNRAALSISLNIAEGSSRTGKDFQHFLSIARGSAYECIPILEIAKSSNLLSEEDYLRVRQKVYEISKMISALRSSISN